MPKWKMIHNLFLVVVFQRSIWLWFRVQIKHLISSICDAPNASNPQNKTYCREDAAGVSYYLVTTFNFFLRFKGRIPLLIFKMHVIDCYIKFKLRFCSCTGFKINLKVIHIINCHNFLQREASCHIQSGSLLYGHNIPDKHIYQRRKRPLWKKTEKIILVVW